MGGSLQEVVAAGAVVRRHVHKRVLIAWATCWAFLVYMPERYLRPLGLVALVTVCLPGTVGPAAAHPVPAGPPHPAAGRYPGRALAPAPHRRPALAPPLLRTAVTSNAQGQLASPPSVSAAAITRAFQATGSPLAAPGPRRAGRTYAEYLWDRGRAVGIDPAVALALFWHESHYGTLGMAVLTHSLANNRPTGPGPVRCSTDGCYAYESDWFTGIDTMYALLQQYRAWGLTTVDRLIPVWAPSTDENDVAAFSASAHETLHMLAALSRSARRT